MRRIIKCVITISLVIGVIYYVGRLVRPIDTDIAFNAIDTFHSIPEESLEVIAYGSSHVWRGLNVMEMYQEYGIGAYNYGCNWQHINTTSLFFQDSLRTQSPKVILIETYLVNDLLIDTDINGEIYYTKGISSFEAKREYLEQCFGDNIERYLSYYVPLCAFHENWNNLKEGNFQKSSNLTDFYKTMGYVYTNGAKPVEIGDYRTFEQKELSQESKDVLDSIVKICTEKDIQVIFYTTPWQGEYCYFDAMDRYAQENGCKYINLFEKTDEMGLDGSTDFSDAGHLNDNGAKKVADYLGNYIVNNYEVTDMRKIEGNQWELCLADNN